MKSKRIPFKDLGITSTPWKKPISKEAVAVIKPEWEATRDFIKEMDREMNNRTDSNKTDIKPTKVVYHTPDCLTGRCWKCGKKRGVKYGGICYTEKVLSNRTSQSQGRVK